MTTPCWWSPRNRPGARQWPIAWPPWPGSSRAPHPPPVRSRAGPSAHHGIRRHHRQGVDDDEASRTGIQRWAGHLGGDPVVDGEQGRRGDRGRRRCGPGRRVGGRGLGGHPHSGPGCRGRRGHGHRCPGGDGRGLLLPGVGGQRQIRGQVPAGVGTVASGDRQAPGGRGPPARRRRGGPRMYRQRERPGSLRGGHPGTGPRPRGDRPGPPVGAVTGGLCRVRGHLGYPALGDQGEALLDRREPLGQGHRVRRDRGPRGAGPPRTCTR